MAVAPARPVAAPLLLLALLARGAAAAGEACAPGMVRPVAPAGGGTARAFQAAAHYLTPLTLATQFAWPDNARHATPLVVPDADDFAVDETQIGEGDWYCIRLTRRQ